MPNNGYGESVQIFGYDWDSFNLTLKAILPSTAIAGDLNVVRRKTWFTEYKILRIKLVILS